VVLTTSSIAGDGVVAIVPLAIGALMTWLSANAENIPDL
jgi:hypothetical protein